MSNADIKGAGPGFIGDLARMGGDVTGSFTASNIANTGAGFIQDLARQGGGAYVSPIISGEPVLEGQDGEPYEGFTVSTEGGEPPYTYTLVGTWPDGISIDSSTGIVSGTFAEDGEFTNLTVRVTDSDSETDELPTFTLTVAAEESKDG